MPELVVLGSRVSIARPRSCGTCATSRPNGKSISRMRSPCIAVRGVCACRHGPSGGCCRAAGRLRGGAILRTTLPP